MVHFHDDFIINDVQDFLNYDLQLRFGTRVRLCKFLCDCPHFYKMSGNEQRVQARLQWNRDALKNLYDAAEGKRNYMTVHEMTEIWIEINEEEKLENE